MGRQVRDLFDIEYGQSLALNALTQTTNESGVAFISRTAKNNGISAWVEPILGVDPFPAGLLTVCLRSRNYTLSTFVQVQPFYCGYHIYVLRPKEPMELREKLWWAQCIQANRYRYNFGRQANTSFANLTLPDVVPDWVYSMQVPAFDKRSNLSGGLEPSLTDRTWRKFRMSDIFSLERGRRFIRREISDGPTPYIRGTAFNNGISQFSNLAPSFPGGLITVASNGSVGEAFFQPEPFVASDDVVVLRSKHAISEATSLFLCAVIRNEQYRFNYGRKWFTSRMQDHILNLPATAENEPDWKFMEEFMMSFPLAKVVFSQKSD